MVYYLICFMYPSIHKTTYVSLKDILKRHFYIKYFLSLQELLDEYVATKIIDN